MHMFDFNNFCSYFELILLLTTIFYVFLQLIVLFFSPLLLNLGISTVFLVCLTSTRYRLRILCPPIINEMIILGLSSCKSWINPLRRRNYVLHLSQAVYSENKSLIILKSFPNKSSFHSSLNRSLCLTS